MEAAAAPPSEAAPAAAAAPADVAPADVAPAAAPPKEVPNAAERPPEDKMWKIPVADQAATASESEESPPKVTALAVPKGPIRDIELVVTSVEVQRVSSINESASTFGAQLYVKAMFPNALEHHPDLAAYEPGTSLETPYFPLNKQGKPTWCPNAAWYLHRLLFDNMCLAPKEQLAARDQEVRIEGNNIVLTIYTEGLFYEKFELQNFPFDSQDLTFSLTLNVRVDGPLGCRLRDGQQCRTVLAKHGFMLNHRWFVQEYSRDRSLLIGA